jgi:catechol 2,3-dioxygenase-like lactoylglutathione lyase family enzyme
MVQRIALVSLLVPDYDEAISYYVDRLGFTQREDTKLPGGKRWVVVSPDGEGTGLLLAKADGLTQESHMGNQSGGRVFLFLTTDDFASDHERLKGQGVEFLEEPRHEPYGMVVVFRDAFGNKWDLIGPA